MMSIRRIHKKYRVTEKFILSKAEGQLYRMGLSTIYRILRRWRGSGTRRSLSTTEPGTLSKNSIPVRTFSEWNESRPGFLEADPVAHCGDSAEASI